MERRISNRLLIVFVASGILALALPVSLGVAFGFLNESSREYTVFSYVATGISLFILFALSIVETVALFVNKSARWETLVITISLFFMALLSNDAYRLSNYIFPNLVVSDFWRAFISFFHFFFFSTALCCFVGFSAKVYGVKNALMWAIVSSVFFAAGLVFFIPFSFFDLQLISILVSLGGLIYFFAQMFYVFYKEGRITLNIVAAFLVPILMVAMEFAEMAEDSYFAVFFTQGFLSVITLYVFFTYFLVYLDFTSKTVKEATKKRESERRAKELQANILKNQVDPHFIFNALNVIKSLYRTNPSEGERALDLLSKNLRSYTKAADQILVPLEKELDIVSDYVELESMKYAQPIEVIYDIEDYDFQVPAFSLQPLVENACRYSGVTTMKDGYIEIRSVSVPGGHSLSVSDNGKGFDVKEVGSDSYGMKNIKERFEILLHALVNIESSSEKGTKITIFIPEKEEGEGTYK